MIWRYSRPASKDLVGDAAGGINRGVAVLGDRVFVVTDNAHLLALHRVNGALLWDTRNGGFAQALWRDLGAAGGGRPGDHRCFPAATKAFAASSTPSMPATGAHVWRFWSIPEKARSGAGDWTGRALEHGCGATWLTGTYDNETDSLIWPIGNPCPDFNGDERKGDNLYHRFGGGAGPQDRQAQMALPVHAARSARLGRHRNADAGGRELPGRAAQAAAAGQPQRLLLCAGPDQRQIPGRQSLRQETDLGQEDRAGWPPRSGGRLAADGGRDR